MMFLIVFLLCVVLNPLGLMGSQVPSYLSLGKFWHILYGLYLVAHFMKVFSHLCSSYVLSLSLVAHPLSPITGQYLHSGIYQKVLKN